MEAIQAEFGRGRREEMGQQDRKPRNEAQGCYVSGKKPNYWKSGFSCDSHKNTILGSSLSAVELFLPLDIFVTNMEIFLSLTFIAGLFFYIFSVVTL